MVCYLQGAAGGILTFEQSIFLRLFLFVTITAYVQYGSKSRKRAETLESVLIVHYGTLAFVNQVEKVGLWKLTNDYMQKKCFSTAFDLLEM